MCLAKCYFDFLCHVSMFTATAATKASDYAYNYSYGAYYTPPVPLGVTTGTTKRVY